MGILTAGERAPDFLLRGLDGETCALSEGLRGGWVLLAFFKLDCQTCLLSIPYWDRLYEEYTGEGFRFWAISLDGPRELEVFIEKSGVEFSVVLDDTSQTASRYGLICTPALFLVDESGAIIESHDAFDKAALNALAGRIAERVGKPALALVGNEAPDLHPGCAIHYPEGV